MSSVSACSSVFTGPACPTDTSPDMDTSQPLADTRPAQSAFWTFIVIDLKATDAYGLGALFHFIFFIFRFCLGLLPCPGSTAFPRPLRDEPLLGLDSAQGIMVLRAAVIWVVPGPQSSCLSLAISGELLHLFFFFQRFIYLREKKRA